MDFLGKGIEKTFPGSTFIEVGCCVSTPKKHAAACRRPSHFLAIHFICIRAPPCPHPQVCCLLQAQLSIDTAKLARGHKAVCCFVNDDLGRPVVAALALAGVRCANTSVFLPPLSIQLAIPHRRCALPAAQSARAAYPAMTPDDAQKISWRDLQQEVYEIVYQYVV